MPRSLQEKSANFKKKSTIISSDNDKRIRFQTAHILCLPAIWHRMKNSSCYKIMFFMSVLDITALPVIAFGSGVFMFMGLVYCEAPTLLYALALPAPSKLA